jgi:putative endonuclease
MKSTTTIGRQGEDLAVDWLRAHGYTLVARNYRRRFGEVDVIARQGEYLVFIEVKTRSSSRFGSPFDAVTLRKQQQLSRIAKDYLVRNKIMDTPCRFDVLSIILAEDSSPTIDIVVNAFEYID